MISIYSKLAAIGLGASLLVGACSASHPTTNTHDAPNSQDNVWEHPIPELDEAQQQRDSVARAEESVENALEELTELATDCKECAEHLSKQAQRASERLETLGGAWEPWNGTDKPIEEQWELEPVPSGPALSPVVTTVSDYMITSGATQLIDVASEPALSADERLATGLVLSQRIAEGTQLAAFFGEEQATDVKKLLSEDEKKQTPAHSSEDDTEESEISSAHATAQSEAARLDCVRSSLLAAPEEALTGKKRLQLSADIDKRVSALLELGVEISKSPRCSYTGASLEEILTDLLAVDLVLFSSSDPAIRVQAAQWLAADAQLWGQALPTPMTGDSAPLQAVADTDNAEGDNQ